jgi:hypothetical protein
VVRPLYELVCWACQSWVASAWVLPPSSLIASYAHQTARLGAELSISVQLATELQHIEGGLQPVPATRVATLGPGPLSIGDAWTLQRGRELSVFLTPSLQRCAPLVEMRF